MWHVPVTAHVVITLSLATRLTGEAVAAVNRVNVQAAEYLSTKMPFLADPYQLAITAYALHRANHRTKDEAYNRLKSKKRAGQ